MSEIVDIHIHDANSNALEMRNAIVQGLLKENKQLPTMLLYDERGLRLYDEITTEAPEYYLFGAEEDILKRHADKIVRVMHGGNTQLDGNEVVLELGSGALRKTSHLLRALSTLVPEPRKTPPITYYALDLENRELERTLSQIMSSDLGPHLDGKVATKGMWGSYDDGLKYVKSGGLNAERSPRLSATTTSSKWRDTSPSSIPESISSGSEDSSGFSLSPPSTPDEPSSPLHILFLGSSLGNFSRQEQVDFLRALPLQPGSGDTLLIGLDHDNEKELIEEAYNDPKAHTRRFIMNGLEAAGRALGDENLFDESNWEYVNKYVESDRKHQAFFKCKIKHSVRDPSSQREFHFLENELVKIEESVKFSEEDTHTLFTASNLRPIQRWTDSTSRYSLWLLERPPFLFPTPTTPSSNNVPTVEDWQTLWSAWDFVTLRMIPPSMLYQKPIDLRHICLFYLGHIPTFLDIHLSRLLDEPYTQPEKGFQCIFERGIDPDVDDPTQCHDHSIVPEKEEDWPALGSILAFQASVRTRLLNIYGEEGKKLDRRTKRVLFMTHEHEALHLETLLYMLLQRAGTGTETGTIPPPGFHPPDWEALARGWDDAPPLGEKTVKLGPAVVSLGHDDSEKDDDDGKKGDQVHEFGWDNEHPKRDVSVGEFRIDWRPVTNGEFFDFYESNKSKVELPACWVLVDGNVFVRTLYGPIPLKFARHWPVMTSYDSLSTYASVKGGRLPTEPELQLFYDAFEAGYAGGANWGFRAWHPVPATTGGGRKEGHNGGVWEWTSTPFDAFEGFERSKLYPGYSVDFFDGKHQVVIGGSYATIPRIAGRRSFRNWYQRNYPYPWIGGRIVYDV